VCALDHGGIQTVPGIVRLTLARRAVALAWWARNDRQRILSCGGQPDEVLARDLSGVGLKNYRAGMVDPVGLRGDAIKFHSDGRKEARLGEPVA
jgi:hypothetical protein